MPPNDNNRLAGINNSFATNPSSPESESRRRLLEQQQLIQTSLDGFFVTSVKNARIIEVNDAFCDMVGYSRAELLTMFVSDLEVVESPDEIAAHIQKVITAGYHRFETRHRHKRGHPVDLEISVSHSAYDGGTNFAFARDITGRKRMEQSAAMRVQEYRSLTDSSPDFIVRYDRDGRHLYLNGKLLKFLELTSAEEVIGKRPSEVWADGRFAELEQAAAHAVLSGSQMELEIVQPTENGVFRYHHLFVLPERDLHGQVVGTLAFGREVTAIREAERKLRHFIENQPGMAYTFRLSPDGRGSFPFVSPAIEELFGLRPEDVMDDMAPLHKFMHPDDRPRIEAALAESACTMTPFRIEARACRPGLPERWLDMRAAPEHEFDGGTIWCGIMLDITERKQAEALLVQREREFRALAVNMPDNIIRYNREAVTIYVNPVLERTLGDSATAMIGTTPREYHPDGAFEDYAQLLDSVLASGVEGKLEKILPGSDGKTRIHQIRMVPELDESGEVVGVLAIGRDISERKQAEQQLRELSAHIQTVREEEKAHLAREIHDDLGSTLAALKLKLSLLLSFELPVEMRTTSWFARIESMLPILDNAVASMRRIITGLRPPILDNLGLMAALEWQAREFNKLTGVECNVICAYKEERGCTDCKGCEYTEDNVLSINLFRIFQESLSNVAHHSGASKVEVELQPRDHEVVLSISDNGRGLLEGHTVAPTSYGIRGMRERVEQLGGKIEFGKPAGGGFSVTVTLPQAVPLTKEASD